MDLDLTDRVALVTGGGSGIGAACVRELSALGALVVVADRASVAAREVAAGVGGPALAVTADVTDPDDVETMVAAATERFGRLDIAVNNAGVGQRIKAATADTRWESWREVVSVNLEGVFLCLRAELAVMPAGGSIVNLGSVMGAVASPGATPYVAAKHGLVGLTKTAALEYAALGIRVNTVAPGFVDTPLLRLDGPGRARVEAAHPLGRLGTAEEVAAVVAFVASPAASFMTGAYVPVDGGYLAH